MSKFIENGFFIENEKVYKMIDGQKKLIVLIKPNYGYVEIEFNSCILNMENIENLMNSELIHHLIDTYNGSLDGIGRDYHRVEDIHKYIDLYAVDISRIWDFHNYDSYIDVVYYDGIDGETNKLYGSEGMVWY